MYLNLLFFRDMSLTLTWKMIFPCPTLMSWLIIQQDMPCCHLWMDFQGTIILRWLPNIWIKPPSLLHRGHIATKSCHLAFKMLVLLTNVQPLLCYMIWSTKRSKSLYWWHDSEVQRSWGAHTSLTEVLQKNPVL